MPAKVLNSMLLPSITGLAASGADVAQSEDGRAVRNDGHEVALARVVVDLLRRLGDDARGNGHAGRIGQRKVVLRAVGLRGNDADLSGALFAVVAQRLLGEFIVGCHCFSLFSVRPVEYQRAFVANIAPGPENGGRPSGMRLLCGRKPRSGLPGGQKSVPSLRGGVKPMCS